MPKLLHFILKHHPLLRETMPVIQDFQDPALHETIEDMIYSILPEQLKTVDAPHANAVGMAANQWGIDKRVFIFAPQSLQEKDKLQVVLNPSYQPYLRPGETEAKSIAAFEGCFSIPLTASLVNRYEAITATYYNVAGEKIERVMERFEARVFQHETDHLDGKLCDGRCDHYPGPECLERIIFKDREEMEIFWQTEVRPTREAELRKEI
jgi:peptide deformylase